MGGPVFSGAVGRRFREIGQLQHLDALGKAVHFLQAEGENKGEPGMVYLFLNPAGHPHPDHLDAVFIGFHINE